MSELASGCDESSRPVLPKMRHHNDGDGDKGDRELHSLARNFLCNPAFGVHSIDGEGHFLSISANELEWLGYTESEVLGKMRFQDLLTESDKERFAERFPKFLDSGVAKDVEYNLVGKHGDVVPVSISGSVVKDGDGKFSHTIAVVLNIRQRKFEERRSRELALLQQKQEMLSLLAHDLRVPIIGSNRLVELLLDGLAGPCTDKQRQCFLAIKEANENVLGRIQLFTEIQKYEVGGLDNHSPDVPFIEIVDYCLGKHAASASFVSKDLTFSRNLDGADTFEVKKSSASLLFDQIVDNAVKYSPEKGEIKIASKNDGECFEFSVRDYGPGIEDGCSNALFDHFWRGLAGQKIPPNTGMGLYLCARIVEAYDGEIFIANVDGGGAQVTVRLPLR